MSAGATGGGPAAGWFPDPGDARLLRYWGGDEWTEHTAPNPAGAYVAPREQSERAKTAWQVVGGLGAAVGIVWVIFVLMATPAALNSAISAESADAGARNDATALGRALQAYYAEHDGAPPLINGAGGNYHVIVDDDPFRVVPISPGVAFGGTSGTGERDWCVWVSAPDGNAKNWRFTAAGNLAAGRC